MIIDQRSILRRLAELQYSRNDQAFQRATFRVRGEVIDIYPAESDELALRVELFDDEVERLSLFDPLTGQIEQVVPRFTIYPKSHYVTPRERSCRRWKRSRSIWRTAARCCWPTTSCWKSSA